MGKLGDEVLPAQRDRVDPELMRRLVDHPLELEGRLRPARPAIGIDRHRVGEDRLDVHVDERRAVIAGHQRAVQPGRDRRRERAEIRAHVGMRVGADRGKIVVRVQRQLDLRHVIAPVGVGHERLGARTGPFHRAVQRLGGKGAERLLGVMKDLRAEPAADIRGDHPQLVLGDAQHEGPHQQPDDMRVLARGVECRLPGPTAEIAHGHARLHRVGDEPVVDELQRGDMRGALERRVHRRAVLLDKTPVVAQVRRQLVMHLRRAVLQRRLHVHDRRQLLDIDLDRLGGVARLLAGLGHHGGDRIAHMAHLALREHRVPGLLHHLAEPVGDLPAAGDPADPLEIGPGKDTQHTGHARGRRRVHEGQPPMRHVRPQEMHIGLTAQIDVVGIIPRAGQKPHVLAPLAAGADASVLRHVSLLW